MQKLLFVLSLSFCSQVILAQKDYSVKKDPWQAKELPAPIPINRQLYHDRIDRLQKQLDESDGKQNNKVEVYGNKTNTETLTNAIIGKVDQYQLAIENLPLEHWKKVTQLQNVEEHLKQISKESAWCRNNPDYVKDLINNYEILYKKMDKQEELASYINNNFTRAFYGNQFMFKTDREALNAVYKNMVRIYPDEMVKKFNEFSSLEAAQDMMAYLAPKKPNLILTYATSTSIERNAVRACQDPLVKKIVEIADKAKSPLRAIVFLDELHAGNLSLAQVNEMTKDNATYFKSLIEQRNKATVLSKKVLDRESKLQALEYVRLMNELHDSPDPVRFKCIETLNAKEIYYLLVLCSDEIYTSSFVGAFNRMLPKMAPLKGDAFLQSVNMDKFRTFIRMCAGYNKLDEYLKTIDEPNRNELMTKFVDKIDQKSNSDIAEALDVADAVDVADAIGSINDEKLVDFILSRLKENYERTYNDNNKRGLIIYFLLHTLTTTVINPEMSNEQLQNDLKVPPITKISYKSLLDSAETIHQQVYFFGDEDGKASYANFLGNFKPDAWKIEKNANWATITSIKGNNTVIYANAPLDEPQDEEAQAALNKHLESIGVKPNIIIHRGHSYHLPITLKNLKPYNKVIILGSCGGYHNLSTILNVSEDAHIISSKQTGTMHVTDPILRQFNARMLSGQDVNWIDLWSEVDGMMNTAALQDKFNDYVPPHKNMGALFLKAFRVQMQMNESL